MVETMNRKRRDDETYEQYKINMENENRAIKIKLEGAIYWNSSTRGTYVKGN